MKKGFTLLEILLATVIMSSGVLTVVVLYSMGFRETRQSNEDIASAAYADAVLSPLVNALSATNVAWSAFKSIATTPPDGWKSYYDTSTWMIRSGCNSTANGAVNALKKVGTSGISWPSIGNGASADNGGLTAVGIVVRHEQNSSVVKIGFRAAREYRMLMAAPLYYTEVHFQGDPEK